MDTKPHKPLGSKAYGSIPHIMGSRLGPKDYTISEGQSLICTDKAPDNYQVYCQTKLDGSCVSVAMLEDESIVPLIRAGYAAAGSHHDLHHQFHAWAMDNESRFRSLLKPGERIVGEWLAQAHSTLYDLSEREPFVAFDLMHGTERMLTLDFYSHVLDVLATPDFTEGPIDPEYAMSILDDYGADSPEGVVYRAEMIKPNKTRKVSFLAKWVRQGKVDGLYFNQDPVMNWVGT